MNNLIETRRFGRYQVIGILGTGSMSTVFRAKDPFLGRIVAVKVIHPHLNVSQEFIKRFEREVATIAGLNHPGIIDVFDMGQEEGAYYMVLKLVSGGTLKERLKSFKERNLIMPLQEVKDILVAVCDTLDYIHKHGIVHRDLKPANIMFNEHNKPVLADFGIVKITGGESYTMTRGVIGTPLYMSPEQCRQDVIDHRCDIYSMGTILYEMTTGKHPFSAPTLGDILLAHLNKRPSSPCDINPSIPRPIGDVILKALEKDPDHRHQTAGELAEAFSRALLLSEGTPLRQDVANFCSVASGIKYKLNGLMDNRIGRSKPGQPVDVDLSTEQGCEYIHSFHAVIRHSQNGWEIEPAQNIQNPVFVNGHEIPSGSKTVLSNGDHVKFTEVELILEVE